MHCCATAFDGCDNLKAGITAYLAHGSDGTTRLLEPDIPRPRRGAGTEQNTLLTLHQWLWETRCITHHAIDNAVEQQFHLSWDVTPIAGCSHDNSIGILNHLQYPLGVILSNRTLQLGTTDHTADARLDVQVVGEDCLHLVAPLLSL